MNPYHDPEYHSERDRLAHTDTPCWRGCGRRATSPDHVPALASHHHERGSGCCQLWPSCKTCNMRAGAAIGNRLRRAGGRGRLAAGSGASA